MKLAILAILNSIQLYLSLKNKTAFSDLSLKHEQRKTDLINEIEKLRDKGDSNSSDNADLLLLQLKTENNEFKYLSTLYASSTPTG